jgi:hypothetical protein
MRALIFIKVKTFITKLFTKSNKENGMQSKNNTVEDMNLHLKIIPGSKFSE